MNVELKAGSCGHCGAPLPAATGPIVVCGFCGRQYHVQASAAPPPAPRGFPVAAPPAPSASPSRRGLLLVVIGTTIVLGLLAMVLVRSVLIAAGTAVSSPAAPRRAPRGGTPATISAAAPRYWYSRFELARVKGDGAVPNIVGLAGFSDGATRLVALEGKSGKLLWSVPDNGGSDVYANGDDVILVYNPTKTVIRRDATSGAAQWTINVAEFVHDISFGPGCASVRFGKPLGIDTETGAVKNCKPAREALLRVERDVLRDVSFQQGDVAFRCGIRGDSKPINPEPTRFEIGIQRGKSPALSVVPRDLSPIWSSDGFSRSVALTPSGLFVFGRDPTDLHARWLLIDSDGQRKYSFSSQSKVEEAVWVTGGGPLVFVIHDRRLETYEAATGKLVWLVGEPS